MTSNPLLTALRQYRHNQGDGFVFGYDKEETDRIVAGLVEDRNQQRAVIAKLVEALEDMIYVANMVDSWECFPSAPIERAEDVIRAHRDQRGEL